MAEAHSIKLVLGKYECINNSQCGNNQYGDIDTHTCVVFPVARIKRARSVALKNPAEKGLADALIKHLIYPNTKHPVTNGILIFKDMAERDVLLSSMPAVLQGIVRLQKQPTKSFL